MKKEKKSKDRKANKQDSRGSLGNRRQSDSTVKTRQHRKASK